MYGVDSGEENPVNSQHALLAAAFGI
jgi:hypothetical protein